MAAVAMAMAMATERATVTAMRRCQQHLSMPSHFDNWKAWSQLALRVNQYKGASDSKMKNFAI
jgi:hypothetical protein